MAEQLTFSRPACQTMALKIICIFVIYGQARDICYRSHGRTHIPGGTPRPSRPTPLHTCILQPFAGDRKGRVSKSHSLFFFLISAPTVVPRLSFTPHHTSRTIHTIRAYEIKTLHVSQNTCVAVGSIETVVPKSEHNIAKHNDLIFTPMDAFIFVNFYNIKKNEVSSAIQWV